MPQQYQHFVPQFFLRNFSHPFKPTRETPVIPIIPQVGKRKEKIHKGEHVVNHVDLSMDTATMAERPVRRVLGHGNMYFNTSRSHDKQNQIEEKLSGLESSASAVFRKILTAFNNRHKGSWLTREERNLIRKFLFVMKYRGPSFYERYHHETVATYFADDKEALLAYMEEKGFSRPIDVWLDNLDALIDLQMDDDQKWMSKLDERMYPHDALWAKMHIQMTFMAVCTPLDHQQEFLVTDNCYHVSEGPHHVRTDVNTGESEELAWLGLHDFAPISPRLIIILRSFLFPSPEEDKSNPQSKSNRQKWRSILEPDFGSISETLLADLPVSKARNNYTELVNGGLRMLPGEDGTLRQDHSFFFEFFPIQTIHVNRINGVFLENSSSCNSIVFNSRLAFRQSLEWYMTDRVSFRKRVTGSAGDSKLPHLKKLATLLRETGSNAQPYWEEITVPELSEEQYYHTRLEELRRALPYLLQHMPDENPTEFMSLYQILGGSKATFPRDMEQSALMIRLRIKIDAWSQGVDENTRQNNRDLLNEVYLGFPRRRLWLYIKRWRFMVFQDAADEQDDDVYVHGSEDAIVKALPVIKQTKLNSMMFWASANQILKTKSPGFDPWTRVTLDEQGLEQFGKLKDFAFIRQIRDCGIDKVEELSNILIPQFGDALRSKGLDTSRQIFTLDEMAEIFTRRMIKGKFKTLLDGELEEDVMDHFMTVFFELLYPTPLDTRWLFNY